MTRALLAALWQSDSAFPSGAFAFSNGVEGAAQLTGGIDAAGLAGVLEMALTHRWATTERLAMLHAFHATDLTRLIAIDQALEAASLAEAFRSGSRRNGGAFLTAHARIGSPGADELRGEIAAGRTPGHLAVAQGWIWRRLGLEPSAAVAVAAHGCAAAIVTAAVRLGAVGAIEAQRVLAEALDRVADLVALPFDPTDEIRFTSMAPWLEIAASRHAHADQRLFSN